MAKYLMQFRYYGNSSDGKNYPSSINKNSLISGSYLISYKPSATSIASLGIQTLPGVKFYLNNSQVDPIIVGPSGIYELGINENYEITGLQFDRKSLDLIDANSGAYLIIDVVYNVEE